jgi:hypothetical protein
MQCIIFGEMGGDHVLPFWGGLFKKTINHEKT